MNSFQNSGHHLIKKKLQRLGIILTITFLTLCAGQFRAWADLPSTIDLGNIGSNANRVAQIFGDDESDLLGNSSPNSFAYGDVNSDGFDDLIIGAPNANPAGGSEAGEIYVIYGTNALSGQTLDLNTDDAISTANETRILGDNGDDMAGRSLASGDVNGDGFDDVIIGAQNADPIGGAEAGAVYVIYGSSALPGQILDLNTAPGSNGETRIFGDDASDLTGYSSASGDINGDGFDDIIIGASEADPPGGAGAGAVYVIYGSSVLPGQSIDLNSLPGSNGETRIFGDDGNNQAGASVTSGDVNGDGFDDVIIGAVRANELYVIYGSTILPGQIIDLNTDGAISAANETRILGEGEREGHSIASGDINGDGFDDIITGAPGTTTPVGGFETGAVYVIYGSSSLPGQTINFDTDGSISAANETRILGDGGNEHAGWSVTSGDVNGDGFDEVITGAFLASSLKIASGEVYVTYGSATLPGQIIDLNIVNSDVHVFGAISFDRLGSSLAQPGGDTNRDGFADFASGALAGDNPSIGGDNNSGYVANIFGDGNTSGSATVADYFTTGTAYQRGMGGRLSPVVRAWIAFEGGDNGAGEASVTTATITRTDFGLSGFGLPELDQVADVQWRITTNRVGFTTASLTLQYTDAEIADLDEENLTLFTADAPDGPWSPVEPIQKNTLANKITAILTEFSYFAIAVNGPSNVQDWKFYD